MFTREELIARLPSLAASAPLPLEFVQFGDQDFTSDEQFIEVYRGAKRDFDSGLLLWVKTLQSQNWAGREAYFVPCVQAGLCDPINEKEFAGIVFKYGQALREPLSGERQRGTESERRFRCLGRVAGPCQAHFPDRAIFWTAHRGPENPVNRRSDPGKQALF
jgi:hypothetical protein